MKTFDDKTIRWFIALSTAALQIGISIFAAYSSSQDRLADGACIGGIFGSLGNLAILSLVIVWAIVLAVKSFKDTQWHNGLKPLSTVALSSVIATAIGRNSALGCTV